jgi:hypothetical protein
MCCPAIKGLIGVKYNYVHRWWFFTSRLRQHNCIILRIRLISLLLSNLYIQLRCNPAKGRLTDQHVSFRKKVFCIVTNGIHFQMVVTCTCWDNMYHYRCQERTPNRQQTIAMLPGTSQADISQMRLAPGKPQSDVGISALTPDSVSVSYRSGLPSFGPGWNRPEGPCPGQEPAGNLTHSFLAELLPGPDINPWFFDRVEPSPLFYITVPATLAAIKHLSSDRIMTWSIWILCSVSRSFTSRCPICDWINICWIAL